MDNNSLPNSPDITQYVRFDEEQGVTIQGKLTLCDTEGRPYCVLGSDSDGGFIHLLDSEGNMVVSVGCDIASGFVDVNFRGERRLAATICIRDDANGQSEGYIEVFDKQGNTIASLPADE